MIDADFNDIAFKYAENDIFEYKENINILTFNKYIETICAFLNTNGGYLIFGIKDNLDLIGITNNQKDIDKFICMIDQIISNSMILQTKDNIITNLSSKNIKARLLINNYNKKFIIIKVENDIDTKYQLQSGLMCHRLNASIYYEKNEKIYKQYEIDNITKLLTEKYIKENSKNIEIFKKNNHQMKNIIQNNELLIQSLLYDKEIYKKHLECVVKNNKIQNNYNLLYSLFPSLFPCFSP